MWKIYNSRIIREYYVMVVINLLMVIMGIDSTFTAYFVAGRNNLKVSEEASIGSVNFISRGISVLLLGYFADKYGRKWTLQLMYIISLIAWLLITIFNDTTLLVFGRILGGIASGSTALCLVYVSEICSTNQKKSFQACRAIFTTFGTNIPIFCGYFFHWKVVSGITCCLSLLGLLNSTLIPETPHWYLLNNQKENAIKSLSWISKKASITEIQEELQNHESSRSNEDKEYINPSINWKFIVLLLIYVFRGGSGRIPLLSHFEHIVISLKTPFNSQIVVLILSTLELLASGIYLNVASRCKSSTLLFTSINILLLSVIGIILNDVLLKHNLSSSIITIIFLGLFWIIEKTTIPTTILIFTLDNISPIYRNKILSIATFLVFIFGGLYSFILPFLLDSTDIHYFLASIAANLIAISIAGHLIVWSTKNSATSNKNWEVVPQSDSD